MAHGSVGLILTLLSDAFFAVQFYPFTAPGVDPVFAVTGGCEVRLFLSALFLRPLT